MSRPFWSIVPVLALAAGAAAPVSGQSSGLPETHFERMFTSEPKG